MYTHCPVTYPKEVEETLGTQMEVEPLDQMKIEDVGLDICNQGIPLSSREVSSFDEPKPQLQLLPNCSSLDESLGEERGRDPPTKPHSPDSLKMKETNQAKVQEQDAKDKKGTYRVRLSESNNAKHKGAKQAYKHGGRQSKNEQANTKSNHSTKTRSHKKSNRAKIP
ncbi:hypothetical protein Tco_1069957 [Tanacetum coccineum]|uniref:Uncharacterized protein n=1 Tax=Tanacetum coccineum TaxID=301880 RepID=A0ABQ5HKD5_9ASTR